MNFTYTLAPEEIQRQVPPHLPAPGLRWWINSAEPYLSGILIALFVISRFPALAGVVVLVVLSVALVVASSALFSRFRIAVGRVSDPMEVVVSAEMISTVRGRETTAQRWSALQRFTIDDDGVLLEFIDGTRRLVPARVFASMAEREVFLTFVVQHAPPSVGFPPVSQSVMDERPLATLASGTWRWSIERTDAARATLWLEDPADERNTMAAEIDDEWVEWTGDRLEAAIGVPSRRDFADEDGIAWRIEFPARNIAEARTIDRPKHLPTIGGLMWVLTEGGAAQDAGLPWTGLAHATTQDLREWFRGERAAATRSVSHQRSA